MEQTIKVLIFERTKLKNETIFDWCFQEKSQPLIRTVQNDSDSKNETLQM